MALDPDFGSPLPRGLAVIGGGWRGPGVHAGLDIAVPQGTPVFAVGDGLVTQASATPRGDLGIFAAITHPSGLVTRYLHFSRLDVAPGARVRKGQRIGLSGNTGNSAAPHLHFDIKVPSSSVLAQVQAAVGKPKTGYEPNVTGFGHGVPAESWIPADGITPTVAQLAKANGIPLYSELPHPGRIFAAILKVGIVAAVGYVGYRIVTGDRA